MGRRGIKRCEHSLNYSETIELFVKSFKEGRNLQVAYYFRNLCWTYERYVLVYDNPLSTWVWSFFDKTFY